jgi:hypothetical protein
MRLAPGALIRNTDVYDSTDGGWHKAGRWTGSIIQPGCTTVWVRPNTELSKEAVSLLNHLVRSDKHHFYLTDRPIHWKVVPSPQWVEDGRMDWKVLHPECVQELIDYGYVHRIEDYKPLYGSTYPMYHPTESGVALIARMRSSD